MNIYELDRPEKGLALIINNLHNEQKATRKDVARLEAMFKKVEIQIDTVKINQDKKELTEIASDLENRDLSVFNVFFLVIISHGLQGDKIVCASGAFDIEFFVESLSKNKSMIGRPKILLFDFCRGDDVNVGEMKASIATSKIPFGSDTFIGFATTKGYASLTGSTGSPFIEAFCDCIEKFFKEESFISIFQEVQNAVSHRITPVMEPTKYEIIDAMQVPEFRSTLRKKLYLWDKSKHFAL